MGYCRETLNALLLLLSVYPSRHLFMHATLGTKPRASWMVDKHCTTKLYPHLCILNPVWLCTSVKINWICLPHIRKDFKVMREKRYAFDSSSSEDVF